MIVVYTMNGKLTSSCCRMKDSLVGKAHGKDSARGLVKSVVG